MNLFFVSAMHIMEGFLSPFWSLLWAAVSIPFVAWGLYSISGRIRKNPRLLMLLVISGAYTFVLSALKIPSVTGSCSHPTGTGLAAVLFGPGAAAVVGLVVLLFQALLLAHGGLTTLGANTFSMAIAGPFVAYGLFRLISRKNTGKRMLVAVFVAASFGDLITYVVTSLQLALAYPAANGGILASFSRFGAIFALTQVPIAIIEGILTVILFNYIYAYNKNELAELSVIDSVVVSEV